MHLAHSHSCHSTPATHTTLRHDHDMPINTRNPQIISRKQSQSAASVSLKVFVGREHLLF